MEGIGARKVVITEFSAANTFIDGCVTSTPYKAAGRVLAMM